MRLLSTLVTIAHFAFPTLPRADDAKAGSWDFTETADKEQTSWHYDLFSSGGMIVGVGSPLPDLKNLSQAIDIDIDFTVSFFFLNKVKEGNYRGLFLEADGKGGQISFGIEGELKDNGKSLSFIGRNQLGDEISRASGRLFQEAPDHKFRPGKWFVREIIAKQKGGWDIYWDFAFEDTEKGITGTGRKMVVNEKDATPGEKKTISKISLNPPNEDGQLKGTGVETNSSGKSIRTKYQGWIAPSGDWFVLQTYENDSAISVIYGTWNE